MEDNRKDVDERREYRRKRRVRNQIISYFVIVILLAAIVSGAVVGITKLTRVLSEKKQAEELAAQLEAMSQEEAVVEPPETEEVIAAPETEPEPEIDWLEEMVETCINEMPLEDKVAGLFIVTPEAITGVSKAIRAGDGTKDALNKYAVGGLVYFSQNIKDKEQLTEMLSSTASMSKYPLFLAVDEEGGSVRRVGSSISVTEVEDMAAIGAGGDTEKAHEAGATIGAYLSELGFNVDFAPVADVVADASESAIGNRSFGGDPDMVGSMTAAMVRGIQMTGVSSCLKHFPGIGSAAEDTHEGMAAIEKSAEELKEQDLIPFQAGIESGVDFVMVGHVSAPNIIGDNTPCSLSDKIITDLLRNELNYKGIVVTDAMNMSAITEYYAADEAAVMALKAGADMILMPEDFESAYEGVLASVKEGVIAEERINESLKKIYRVKYRDRVAQDTEADSGSADVQGEEAILEDEALSEGAVE